MGSSDEIGRGRDDDAGLVRWVERELRGTVTRITRIARWRPAWDIDVEVGGRVVALHARGEREASMLMPFRIADEVVVHDLLEAHGLPVPHAYGICEDPRTLVMDRLPGHVEMSFAASDAERERLIDEYLELLARAYEIPVPAAVAAGLDVPADDAATALGYFRRIEAEYDPLMEAQPVDPMVAFFRRWLAEHVPPGRHGQARFVLYDAFQFMFADGRVTGLLDFELAHVGDPMMDLAALRVRDTIKSIGDLAWLAARYERVTGITVDHDVVEFHCVLYNVLSVISTRPALAVPAPGTDWLSYLAWYTNGARWAFEVIAEMRGYELAPVAIPEPRPTRHAPAIRHLVDGLRTAGVGAGSPTTGVTYERVALGKLANHLRRIDEVGPAFDDAALSDLAEALGRRPDPDEADAALVDLVLHAGPEREEELVRLLDARAQRMQLTLASPSSRMVRHPRLRSLRADRPSVRVADDGWPAGSIPGTA